MGQHSVYNKTTERVIVVVDHSGTAFYHLIKYRIYTLVGINKQLGKTIVNICLWQAHSPSSYWNDTQCL